MIHEKDISLGTTHFQISLVFSHFHISLVFRHFDISSHFHKGISLVTSHCGGFIRT